MATTPTIIITGPAGSGKTTIALAIEEALRGLGINVSNNDVDVVVGSASERLQGQRIMSMVGRAAIPICTVTTMDTPSSAASSLDDDEVDDGPAPAHAERLASWLGAHGDREGAELVRREHRDITCCDEATDRVIGALARERTLGDAAGCDVLEQAFEECAYKCMPGQCSDSGRQ